MMIFGECDNCGAKNRVLTPGVAYGIEGAFCRECRGDDLSEDRDDLLDEIERLKPPAETGSQWAHLCALQSALDEMDCAA